MVIVRSANSPRVFDGQKEMLTSEEVLWSFKRELRTMERFLLLGTSSLSVDDDDDDCKLIENDGNSSEISTSLLLSRGETISLGRLVSIVYRLQVLLFYYKESLFAGNPITEMDKRSIIQLQVIEKFSIKILTITM